MATWPRINGRCALSVTDYKKMFKSERGSKMRWIVRAAVGFERISNRGPNTIQ